MKTALTYFAIIFGTVISIDSCYQSSGKQLPETPVYKYSVTDGYYNHTDGNALYTNHIKTHISKEIEFVAQDGKTYKIPYPYYAIAEYEADSGQYITVPYRSSEKEWAYADSFERDPGEWEIDPSTDDCSTAGYL